MRRLPPTLPQEFTAELFGTFAVTFAGCGAIMTDAITGGAVTHAGVAVAFGAAVAVMVYCFGHVSGSHLNPAVTLAFWVGGAHPTRKVLPYLAAQVLGAVAAAAALKFTLGEYARLSATLPLNGNWQQAFAVEVVLSFILMLAYCGSGLGRRTPAAFAGAAVGLAVMLGVMAMGPISGAGMNPVRSFGPAVVGRTWDHHWLYWVGPIVGAMIAAGVYRAAGGDAPDDADPHESP